MKRAAILLALAVAPSAANAEAPQQLSCTTQIVEAKWGSDMTPKTEFGKQFASFTIDQTIDPDQGWMHQNVCVTKADFVKASFPGSICVVAVGSRVPAAVDGAPGLYLDVIHSVTKNRKKRLEGGSLNLSTSYPMPLQQLDLLLSGTAHSQKYGVASITLNCIPK